MSTERSYSVVCDQSGNVILRAGGTLVVINARDVDDVFRLVHAAREGRLAGELARDYSHRTGATNAVKCKHCGLSIGSVQFCPQLSLFDPGLRAQCEAVDAGSRMTEANVKIASSNYKYGRKKKK